MATPRKGSSARVASSSQTSSTTNTTGKPRATGLAASEAAYSTSAATGRRVGVRRRRSQIRDKRSQEEGQRERVRHRADPGHDLDPERMQTKEQGGRDGRCVAECGGCLGHRARQDDTRRGVHQQHADDMRRDVGRVKRAGVGTETRLDRSPRQPAQWLVVLHVGGGQRPPRQRRGIRATGFEE